MIFKFLLINYNLLIYISSIIIKPKLCIDCKHFTKDYLSSNKFGKCALFPTEDNSKYFLVYGIKEKNKDFYYCSTARNYEDMCGNEGKFFVKKEY